MDSAFSLEPDELKSLVVETERAWLSLGQVWYGPTEAEQKSLMFRRSVYFAEDIQAGEVLTAKNLRVVRPGFGLHPRFYQSLLGKRARNNIEKGTPVVWELIE